MRNWLNSGISARANEAIFALEIMAVHLAEVSATILLK
jgi:hypothetical protein